MNERDQDISWLWLGGIIFGLPCLLGLLFAIAVALTTKARADVASVFAEPQRLACGGRNDHHTLGVAHKTLPCGTRVELCRGGRCIIARVKDRGPYKAGRQWDLMPATASGLGRSDGVFHVSAKVLR